MRLLALFIFCLGVGFSSSSHAQRPGGPPPEAFAACNGISANGACSFRSPHGTISGSCLTMPEGLICVPSRRLGGRPGQRPDQQSGQRPNRPSGANVGPGNQPGNQPGNPQSSQQIRQSNTKPLGNNADLSHEDLKGGTFKLTDTGQRACYDAGSNPRMWNCPSAGKEFYGQDAQYKGNAPRYTNNGDDTISDQVTGLMWQKNFQRNVAWSDAPALAARATTGGHTDWRVPNIKELYSLMNFEGATGRAPPDQGRPPGDATPYIDTDYFSFEYPSSAGGRFIDAQYITSTAYVGNAMGNAAFFGVNFADGRIKGYPQRGRRNGRGWYLRLVRGNRSYGSNKFRDDGNGGVSDLATGLTWMQADSGHSDLRGLLRKGHFADGRMDWSEALAYCENLTHAASHSWRLPNAKELQSLVDYSRSPQTTRSAAINPLFHATRITDEAGKPNYPGYWSSTTHLDGRYPGDRAVVVFFGEALGAPSFRPPGGPGGGYQSSSSEIIDVHGAGAQRSDPKAGDPDDYPKSGQGPQGDVIRVFNYVRCVRDAG